MNKGAPFDQNQTSVSRWNSFSEQTPSEDNIPPSVLQY